MLQAMIVEDNLIYRYAVSTIIDWEAHGFRLAAEAVNGRQALDIMAGRQMDLVITDISMPEMNGIELMKEMARLHPGTKTVVLSSYDDFRIVKEALQMGAYDYLLKHELKPETLTDLLHRVSERIGEGSKLERERRRMQEEYKERLLQKLLLGEAMEQPLAGEEGERLLLPFRKGMHAVVLYSAAGTGVRPDSVLPLLHRLPDSAAGVSAAAVHMGKQRYAAIIAFEQEKSAVKMMAYVHEFVSGSITSAMQNGIVLTAGVSKPDLGLGMLPASFKQAEAALYKQVYDVSSTIHSIDNTDSGDVRPIDPSLVQELTSRMKAGRYRDMETAAAALFAEVEVKRPEASVLHRMMLDLYAWLHVLASEKRMEVPSLDHWNSELNAAMERFDPVHDLKSDFLKAYGGIFGNEQERLCKRREILSAMEYIHTHYREDVSVAELSNELNLSANYLSNLFKAETGKRIVEYMNGFRIGAAKRLLEDSRLKVYEVAEKTGFREVSYFCKVFKEETGMTVSDFRNISIEKLGVAD